LRDKGHIQNTSTNSKPSDIYDMKELIKVAILQKKRPLFLEVFLSFTKSNVSLFPLF